MKAVVLLSVILMKCRSNKIIKFGTYAVADVYFFISAINMTLKQVVFFIILALTHSLSWWTVDTSFLGQL